MAYSYIQYAGNGSTTNFMFAFGYLSRDHVHVTVDGVEVPFEWMGDFTVGVTPAPAVGTLIDIRRNTPLNQPAVDWVDGSTLTEADMDLDSIFNLYTNQEARDYAEASVQLDNQGVWDGRGRATTNFADPTGPTSLVTKKYFDDVYTPALDAKVAAAAASASASASSASSSASSAVNSANSADESEAALDEFKKRYQGARPTDPTTRYDGSPLQVGDLYYNSTANEMRVWASGNYWEEATPTIQAIMEGTFNAPIIATAGQAVVPVVGGYDSPFIIVWVNGSQIEQPEIDVSDGQNIVFTTPLAAGDEVTYRAFGAFRIVDEGPLKRYHIDNYSALVVNGDWQPAFLAALADADGRDLFLESGSVYEIKQPIVYSGNVSIRTTGSAKAVIFHNGQSFDPIKLTGSIAKTTQLTNSMQVNNVGWEVADVTGVTRGMLMEVKSSASWYHDPRPESSDVRKSELHRVAYVEGNKVYCEDPANDGYDLSTETVEITFYNPIRVSLTNIVIRAVQPAYATTTPAITAIRICFADEPALWFVDAEFTAAQGIFLEECYRPLVFEGESKGCNEYFTGYGVHTYGTAHAVILRRKSWECRKCVDVSGGHIVSRHTLVEGCVANGGGKNSRGQFYNHSDAGILGDIQIGFGTHGPSDHAIFRNNTVINMLYGMSLISRNNIVEGNYFVGRFAYPVIINGGENYWISNNRAYDGWSKVKDGAVHNGWATVNDHRPNTFVRIGPLMTAGAKVVVRDNDAQVQLSLVSFQSGTQGVELSVVGNHVQFATPNVSTAVSLIANAGTSENVSNWEIRGNDYTRSDGGPKPELLSGLTLTSGRVSDGLNYSGGWVPTLTPRVNVNSATLLGSEAKFSASGKMVTVSGAITVTPTAAGSAASLRISPPIPAVHANNSTAANGTASSGTGVSGYVVWDSVQNVLQLEYLPQTTSPVTLRFVACYDLN